MHTWHYVVIAVYRRGLSHPRPLPPPLAVLFGLSLRLEMEIILYLCLYLLWLLLLVWGGHICGRQRAACRSQLSPSTMCVSGIILRLSGLAVNTFTLNRLSEPSLWPQVIYIYALEQTGSV